MLSAPRHGGYLEAGLEIQMQGVTEEGSQVRFFEEVSEVENETDISHQFLMELQDANAESNTFHNTAALKALQEMSGVEMQSVNSAEDLIIQLERIPRRFTYNELSVATRGFCEASKLGRGGFGSVYRGVLPSGNPVAVKRMHDDSTQSQGVKEFKSEVSVISQLSHRNLIELQGWCEDLARKEYMLVFELMPNGSLDDFLFKPGDGTPCLPWPLRFAILNCTANALYYLHHGWNQQVIHRDIKCSNILLDREWNAKLADFGIARIADHHQEAPTTIMAGTMGYIAPEVLIEGRFTAKTDVFAFGVVILEVACGRRVLPGHAHKMGLVKWVTQCLSKGDLLSTVDKRLRDDYDMRQMKLVLMIGLACCDFDPQERPSMRHIVQALGGDAKDELMKIILRIEEKEIFNSIQGVSASDSSKIEQKKDNHSRKKVHWQPFRSGSNQQGKKIWEGSFRLSGNCLRIGWPLFREENTKGMPKRFRYKQLTAATGRFSELSIIGDGSFGTVYRGMLPSGTPIAVRKMPKMLDRKEFMTELSISSQLKQKHVLQLLGWCEDVVKNKYLLVFELLNKEKLETVLFERAGKKTVCLTWQQRFNIVISVATVLHYLHQGQNKTFILRNISSHSILLDEEWNAKLCLLGQIGEVEFDATKANVYSFGVVVLEVACGRKAISYDFPKGEVSLVAWVQQSAREGCLLRVLDKGLGNYDSHWMGVLLIVGLVCTKRDPAGRPHMSQVLQMLAGDVPVPSSWEIEKQFCATESISVSDTSSDLAEVESKTHYFTSSDLADVESKTHYFTSSDLADVASPTSYLVDDSKSAEGQDTSGC